MNRRGFFRSLGVAALGAAARVYAPKVLDDATDTAFVAEPSVCSDRMIDYMACPPITAGQDGNLYPLDWPEEAIRRAERLLGMTRQQACEPCELLRDLPWKEATEPYRCEPRTELPPLNWKEPAE